LRQTCQETFILLNRTKTKKEGKEKTPWDNLHGVSEKQAISALTS